jgi:hypothetical protein
MSGSTTRSSIRVVCTYFGNWPVWFPAFLLSCARNESIDWLIFTDCAAVPGCPPNVTIHPFSLKDLNQLASAKLGIEVRKSLYSQCDLRPAYGVIFQDYLTGCDFWAHCDLDVVWGDIRNFIHPGILESSDVISSRLANIAGHFTVWRNTGIVNNSFRSVSGWHEQLSQPTHYRFDEDVITDFLANQSSIRMHWPEHKLIDYLDLEAQPYGWRWSNGKLYDGQDREVFYMHFMTWKRYLNRIDFSLGDAPDEFWITRRGIWSASPPPSERVLQLLNYDRHFASAIRLKRALEQGVWLLAGDNARKNWEQRKRRQW